MSVTVNMVKELRDMTGAGMMDCKKALQATEGDVQAAQVWLREKGIATAGSKSNRATGEGLIASAQADGRIALIEVNCETDFVARDEHLQGFVALAAQQAASENSAEVDALLASSVEGQTIEEHRAALVAKVGENIQVARVAVLELPEGAVAANYQHGQRIGVITVLTGSDELAKDVAIHIAACKPLAKDADAVDPALIEQEKAIYQAQAAESGKPAEIVEKMISGKLNKYLAENTLMGQGFVKDPDTSVGALLEQNKATLHDYVRFEVGESA